MRLMPGVPELCTFLDQQRIPRGLITRNVKASVDFLHQQHLLPLHSLTGVSNDQQGVQRRRSSWWLHVAGFVTVALLGLRIL